VYGLPETAVTSFKPGEN